VAYLRAERGTDPAEGAVPKKVKRLAVTHASRLSWQPSAEKGFSANTTWPETLLLAMRPVSQLEAIWESDTLKVRWEGGEGIRVRAYGAQWLSIDGERKMAIPKGSEWVTLP
jgi:hypothetical protein